MDNEWKWVEGYDNGSYTDDSIFEIDPKTKQLQVITDQTLVSGENKSQFIRFQMDRFCDGIDLSTKSIQIIYITESGYSDINAAVCVEKSESQLRFGWVVPLSACYDVGTLSFGIEFVGDDYTLKTRACDIEVYDGINGGEVIPEPGEKVWYIELQQRCDFVLNKAEDAKNAAENYAAEADKSQAAALESETKAKVSETEAAASEAAAAEFAESAATSQAIAEKCINDSKQLINDINKLLPSIPEDYAELSASVGELRSDLSQISPYVQIKSYQWEIGYRIATNTNPVDITAVYPSPNYSCVIIPVILGQKFMLTAHASNSIYNAYCFTDRNYKKLIESGAGSFIDYVLDAPEDGYLICCTDDNNYHTLMGIDPVPQLLSDVTQINWESKNVESITFPESFYERGTFGSSGSEIDDEDKIRTKEKIMTTRDVKIIPKTGYLVQIVYYNNKGVYEGQTPFISEPYTLTAGKQFRIAISNTKVTYVVELSEKNAVIFQNATYDEYIMHKSFSDLKNYNFGVKETLLKYNANRFGTESNSNGVVYRVGANRQFTTIGDAIYQWAEDNYPAATVFIDNGVYKETNTVEGHTIRFIGESKDGTIIHTTSGNYTDPPFNIRHGNVTLKNMTLIADHSENPDFDYEVGGPLRAYGVHIDGGSVGGIVTIENCTIMSFQAPAVGTGTIPNSKIRLIDCDCYCFTDYTADKNTNQAYQLNLGCILWHTSNSELYPTRGDESFELVNVRAYMENNYVVFKTNKSYESDKMDTLAINTLLFSNRNPNNQNPVSGPINSVDGSMGNSVDVLNYES